MSDKSTAEFDARQATDEEVIRQLGDTFLAEVAVRVMLETQDPDQAIHLLRNRCRRYLEESGLGETASAIHLDKSKKQVKRWGQLSPKGQAGGAKGYALFRAVLTYFLEHEEGATAGQCLGAIADKFRRVSAEDLLELLDFYCRMGYLVREGERYRRARAALTLTPRDREERLARVRDTLENIWPALRGYVIGEAGFEVKRVGIFATELEFREFMGALRQFIDDWGERRARETSTDGQDPHRTGHVVLLLTSNLNIREQSEFEQFLKTTRSRPSDSTPIEPS